MAKSRPRCGRCGGPNGKWYRKIEGQDGLICDKCQQKQLQRKFMSDAEWSADINARIAKLLS